MDYFAGLDISMDETHVCVFDCEGEVVHESKSASTAEAIAGELAKAPSYRRIVFETGRMAPILFHGLSELGLPVVCVESRQAYQALKSLATHKTDRNDARGLAHLARTGFFKPVHVKSLSAHAVRTLIIALKKLVGQRVTLENQYPRFGGRVRDPAASRSHCRLHRSGSQSQRGGRRSLRRHARTDCCAHRGDERSCGDRRRHQAHDDGVGSLPKARGDSGPWPTDCPRLCRCNRRSLAHPPITRRRRLSGPRSKTTPVWGSGLCRRHLKMRRPAGADPAV